MALHAARQFRTTSAAARRRKSRSASGLISSGAMRAVKWCPDFRWRVDGRKISKSESPCWNNPGAVRCKPSWAGKGKKRTICGNWRAVMNATVRLGDHKNTIEGKSRSCLPVRETPMRAWISPDE